MASFWGTSCRRSSNKMFVPLAVWFCFALLSSPVEPNHVRKLRGTYRKNRIAHVSLNKPSLSRGSPVGRSELRRRASGRRCRSLPRSAVRPFASSRNAKRRKSRSTLPRRTSPPRLAQPVGAGLAADRNETVHRHHFDGIPLPRGPRVLRGRLLLLRVASVNPFAPDRGRTPTKRLIKAVVVATTDDDDVVLRFGTVRPGD